MSHTASPEIVRHVPGRPSESAAWEDAYRRFESPDAEVRKFVGRLHWFGVDRWPRDVRVVELFCGRGNGLVALAQLGFSRLEGVDLSSDLLAEYRGPAQLHQADCRNLPFPDASRDLLVCQGGLHHLAEMADLDKVLGECRRVLVPGGRLLVVEPWSTPFLFAVHWVAFQPAFRRLISRLDHLATMIEHERDTYERWLAAPAAIKERLHASFQPVRERAAWGKLYFLGQKSI